MLRKALSDAERLGLVYRNAAASVRGPSVERPEIAVWSSEEGRQFLAAAASNRLHAAFVLLTMTGMLRGEVLGARWKDLDLDARKMSIRQTLTVVDFTLTSGQIVLGPCTDEIRYRRQHLSAAKLHSSGLE